MIMDPPLVNEASFSAANPSSYSLSEMWPFTSINAEPASGGHAAGLRLQVGNLGPGFGERDGSAEESTVTEQSGGANVSKRRYLSLEDESSKLVSTTCSGNELNDSNGKQQKLSGTMNYEIDNPKADVEASSATTNKAAEQSSTPSKPPKQDYIHVRARRGQATDSHSLAERARREKISERMKMLQDLVPGCNKVIGKALVLDEIINYIQSLQHQVEFLSMKLETFNTRMDMNPMIESYHLKEFVAQPFDASGMMYGSQATRECPPGSEPEWIHMQVGGSFARTS